MAGATGANVVTLDSSLIRSGVTIESTSHIKVLSNGIYNLQFSFQLFTTSINSPISIWLSKGGVNVLASNTVITVPGNSTNSFAAWNFMIPLLANEYVELYWNSTDTGMTILHSAAGTNPTIPEAPAVIVTINQVA